MKQFFCIMLAAMTLLMPSVSLASDWRYVASSPSNSVYFIDIDSIRDVDTPLRRVRVAWFRTDDTRNLDVKYQETKLFIHFQCHLSQWKIVQWIEYDNNGRVLDSGGSEYNPFTAAPPDSVGYSMTEAACMPASIK